MTAIEYYKLNRKASKELFKMLGIVMTTVFSVIFMLTSMEDRHGWIDAVFALIFCAALGNLLAASFFSLRFSLGYHHANGQMILFAIIPNITKENYAIRMGFKALKTKYDFLEFIIVGFDKSALFNFEYDKSFNRVLITIRNEMDNISDFNAKKNEIDRKYKEADVFLSGSGLRKTIKWKEWLQMSEADIQKIIDELNAISKKENIQVLN